MESTLARRPSGDAVPSLFVRRSPAFPWLGSIVPQPRSVCGHCFPSAHPQGLQTPSQPEFVNLFDFSNYGGPPWPLLPGVSAPRRFLCDVRYTLSTPLSYRYPNLQTQVLASKRVREAAGTGDLLKRAAACFFEIRANLNMLVCRAMAWVLFKVFRRAMRRLLVSPAQMHELQRAESTGLPLLYLPLHRSHFDYLLLTWNAWHWNLRLPHIAAGDNLHFPGFGWFMRAIGSFFIRRRWTELDAPVKGEQKPGDQVYRAVLHSYLEQVLAHGQALEFFLEGTRCRFGKPLHPKNGLISNVVDSLQQGVIRDCYLVPVAVTYDRVIEGLFLDELMGKPRQRESLWSVVKGVWKTIFGTEHFCGTVRLNFGRPVRLTEYATALMRGADSEKQDPPSTPINSPHYRELLPAPVQQAEIGEKSGTDPKRRLARAIGHHVIHEASRISAISPVSLVAALLLGRYRDHKVSVQRLAADFQWLAAAIAREGVEICAERETPEREVETALESLDEEEEVLFFESAVQLRRDSHGALISLAYHRNAIVPALGAHSLLCLSIVSWSKRPVSKENLLNRALRLTSLLELELIVTSPCQSARDRLAKVLDEQLSHSTLGIFERVVTSVDGAGFVGFEIGNQPAVALLATFTQPYLQTYELVVNALLEEGRKPQNERAWIRALLREAVEGNRPEPKNLLLEAVNFDSARNAIALLRMQGLIVVEDEGPRVQNRPALESLRAELTEYQKFYAF